MDPRARRPGHRIAAASVRLAAAFVVQFAVAGASPAWSDVALPEPRTSSLADFYATLRATAAGDSMPELPSALREPVHRMGALTEFLPDSLALRTPQQTVLIMHRRNPRHRAQIERLLWRRLDPALSTLSSPDQIPSRLDRIAMELRPTCGPGADSIRAVLGDLYRSAYPLYLSTVWPAHHAESRAFGESLVVSLAPGERRILSHLSRKLAMPLPDSSAVRLLVVAAPLAGRIGPVAGDGGTFTIVVSARSQDVPDASLSLLRDYLRAAEASGPEMSDSAPRRLARDLETAMAPPEVLAQLPGAFLDYAIAKSLQEVLNWNQLSPLRDDAAYAATLRKNWNAYLGGGIELGTACAAIASEASLPAR